MAFGNFRGRARLPGGSGVHRRGQVLPEVFRQIRGSEVRAGVSPVRDEPGRRRAAGRLRLRPTEARRRDSRPSPARADTRHGASPGRNLTQSEPAAKPRRSATRLRNRAKSNLLRNPSVGTQNAECRERNAECRSAECGIPSKSAIRNPHSPSFVSALALALALPMAAYGAMRGSPHDFTAQGWSGGALCGVCHTPHHADLTVPKAPLWNHKISDRHVYPVLQPDAQSHAFPAHALRLEALPELP